MRERKSDNPSVSPWRVPVSLEEVGEDGRHFDLIADEDTRAAIARVAEVRDLPRLEANFDVTRHGADGLRVAGRVAATVGQNCVVTLEPLANEVQEDINLVFAPLPLPDEGKTPESEGREPRFEKECAVTTRGQAEPLIGGVVDLGALATEFFILGVDPYPRSPDAIFEPPQDVKPDEGPFAVLAQLTKTRDG